MRQNKKENKNKRKNEEWIQKARHASSVKDIAHVIETMQFHRIFGLVDETGSVVASDSGQNVS